MKKYFIIAIIIILPCSFLLVSYIRTNIETTQLLQQEHRWLHNRKFNYARTFMNFEPRGLTWEGYHYEVFFVHNADEAYRFLNYKKVMWPSLFTERALMEINYIIKNYDINVYVFGLSYPISIINAVDDWEALNNLLFTFNMTQQFNVMDAAVGWERR